MKYFHSQKAFTLIEILLVTSVISLLSTVVVSQSEESRLKADDAHMKQESHQIANAVNLYKNDNNGKVPVGDTQRNANYPIVYENDTDGTAAAYQESMQILVDGGYLAEIPTSPRGESYSYYVTEDEENAMFAAELNFESSNSSGSNSCEFVDILSYDPTNCDVLNSFANYDPETETTEYNFPEGWVVFDIASGDYTDFCNRHGDPICSGGDGTASSFCSQNAGTYTFNGQEYPQCLSPIFIEGVVCEGVDNSVCDGSSNSDYCSCI
jgi:prepilin-type N-terminal cleavage/methylation domain-containing protein